jgi:hypothetical protein
MLGGFHSKQASSYHNHHWLDSPTWALAFLRSSCQLTYPAISSSDFVTRVFSRMGLSAPRPTPGYPAGSMFSVRVVSLSRLVPILKRQDLAFALAWLSCINVAQEPWVDMHATDLVRINNITWVLLVYTCQQGVYPRGHVRPLRIPQASSSRTNNRKVCHFSDIGITGLRECLLKMCRKC